MIQVVKGNLLTSDCTILAHQANCFSTFGAGIAKQIKALYPEAYEADCNFPCHPRERLGKFSFALSKDKSKMIFNLYGQFRYGSGKQYTDYEALKNAINMMLKACQMAEERGFAVKIGLPYKIGAGLAGGNWEIIYSIIDDLSNQYGRDIYLYQLKE